MNCVVSADVLSWSLGKLSDLLFVQYFHWNCHSHIFSKGFIFPFYTQWMLMIIILWAPQEYSMPSPTSLGWHFSVRLTRIPMDHPLIWSSNSSSWKLVQEDNKYFRLVSSISSPFLSFLPSSVYWLRLLTSMKPHSHKLCRIPFGWPSHPCSTFGIFSSSIVAHRDGWCFSCFLVWQCSFPVVFW